MFVLTQLESHEHLGYIQEVTVPDTSLTQVCMLGEEQEWREFREIFVNC